MTITHVTCEGAIAAKRMAAVTSRRQPARARRLMAVLAHPDDESLGVGGTLAKYAEAGVEVFLLTATRGDGGRYRSHRPGDGAHPGRAALGNVREAEVRAAARALGLREVALFDYRDQSRPPPLP